MSRANRGPVRFVVLVAVGMAVVLGTPVLAQAAEPPAEQADEQAEEQTEEQTGRTAPATSVVLHDGQAVTTRNGFELQGRMVVFTDSQGKLRSIPLKEVDLEASRRSADKPAVTSAESETAQEPEPVLVLENDDLPSVDEAERERSREAAAERRRVLDLAAKRSRADQDSGGGRRARPRRPFSSSGAEEGTTAGLATVSHWSSAKSRQTRGIEIVGSVANPSEENLDRVTVKVKLFDKDGKLVKTGRAFVDRTRLAPGRASNFRYLDPTLQSLDGLAVEFRVTARALSWGARRKVSDDDIPTFQPGDGG